MPVPPRIRGCLGARRVRRRPLLRPAPHRSGAGSCWSRTSASDPNANFLYASHRALVATERVCDSETSTARSSGGLSKERRKTNRDSLVSRSARARCALAGITLRPSSSMVALGPRMPTNATVTMSAPQTIATAVRRSTRREGLIGRLCPRRQAHGTSVFAACLPCLLHRPPSIPHEPTIVGVAPTSVGLGGPRSRPKKGA